MEAAVFQGLEEIESLYDEPMLELQDPTGTSEQMGTSVSPGHKEGIIPPPTIVDFQLPEVEDNPHTTTERLMRLERDADRSGSIDIATAVGRGLNFPRVFGEPLPPHPPHGPYTNKICPVCGERYGNAKRDCDKCEHVFIKK
jgi:hypothetical protein